MQRRTRFTFLAIVMMAFTLFFFTTTPAFAEGAVGGNPGVTWDQIHGSSASATAEATRPTSAGSASIFHDTFVYTSLLGYTEGDWDARIGLFNAFFSNNRSGNYFDMPLEITAAAGSGDSQAAEAILSGRYNFNLLGDNGVWTKLVVGVGGEIANDSWIDSTETRPILQVALQFYGLDASQRPDGTVTSGPPIFGSIKYREIFDDRHHIAIEGGSQGIKLYVYANFEDIVWIDGDRNYLNLEGRIGANNVWDSKLTLWVGGIYREYLEDSEKFAGNIVRPGPAVGLQYPIDLGSAGTLKFEGKLAYFFRSDAWIDSNHVEQSEDKSEAMGQIVLVWIPND